MGPSPLEAATTPASWSASPSSTGMKPLVRDATSASSGGRGTVMFDAKHQLVEDQELADPQHTKRADRTGRDARGLEKVRTEVRFTERAGEVGGPRRQREADEVQRPERNRLFPEVTPSR